MRRERLTSSSLALAHARRALSVAAPLLLLLPWLSAAPSCSYQPDFANDQLQCGAAGECPKGYSCATDNKCWKTGAQERDAGPTGGDAGDTRLTNFAGTWTFNTGPAGGTLVGTCSDGSFTQNLGGDFMVLTLGGPALVAQYYCDNGWNLRLPAGSSTTVVQPNQMCTHRTTDAQNITTSYVLSALEFGVTTTNGQSATFSGRFSGPFSASDGSTGTCSFVLSGKLSKTAP